MISIKVKAVMQLAAVLGCREQVICLQEGARLKNLIAVLEETYGKGFAEMLYRGEDRELRPEIQLLLNGRNMFFLAGLNTQLEDGDELFFLSPVGGG